MKLVQKLNLKSSIIPMALICIAFGYKPGADSLNPAKLTILGIFAALALVSMNLVPNTNFTRANSKPIRIFISLVSLFILFLCIALLFTDQKTIGLFGETNRNLGFLNYFFLSIIAMFAAFNTSIKDLKHFYWAAIFLATILSIYGIFQYFDIDFIHWQKPSGWIVLLAGNPDLASSLLALLATLIFSMLFFVTKVFQKIAIISLVGLLLVVIVLKKALQGLIGFELGVFFILFVVLIPRRKYLLPLLILQLTGMTLAGLGALNHGPVRSYLHKISVVDRGYDWKAAIGMFKSHPFSGVGLDRYGSYFAQYRSSNYPLLFGYKQTVNNAHNIILEFLATGGIFLAIAYLALLFFVAFRAYVTIQKLERRDQLLFSGIIAAWLVYVAQSLISIDTPVLSIWGWTLSGVIVGISAKESHSKTQVGTSSDQSIVRSLTTSRTAARLSKVIFASFSAATVILILGAIFVINQNETNALKFNKINVKDSSFHKQNYFNYSAKVFSQSFMSPTYKYNIAFTLLENGYISDSVTYLKKIVRDDPRNLFANTALAIVYEHFNGRLQAIEYRKKLQLLDPYNAMSLVELENDYLLTANRALAMATRDSIIAMAPGTDVAKRAAALITK